MVGLSPSGYRIIAHDGHLESCYGNKQAIAPVGVSPMCFSAVSYLGAFSILAPKSGCKRLDATRKQRLTRGAPTLRVPSLSGVRTGHCGRAKQLRHVAPALGALRRRYAFWGVLGAFWARSGLDGLQNALSAERSLDGWVAAFGLP